MLGPAKAEKDENGDPLDPVDQSRKVQFLFEKMDINKDGRVSLEEFIDVCTKDEALAELLVAC